MRSEEPSDFGQKGRGYGNDGLVVGVGGRLVRGHPLLVRPRIEFGNQFLDALLIPAFGRFSGSAFQQHSLSNEING
jgi:hypothetical protein